MNSFFNKSKKLITPESLIINKLQSLTSNNNFLLYKNLIIYSNGKQFKLPLLILDLKKGIYIFEKKDWSYDDLKNSEIRKLTQYTKNRLYFEKIQTLIQSKLRNTANKNIPIFKFLLLENLNIEQYDYLNSSFQDILPKEKVFFNDTTEDEIFQKLQNVSIETHSFSKEIMSDILPQYAIKNSAKSHLCTDEQIKFIDADTPPHSTLNAQIGSGRTQILLLKAILEILNNNELKIVIVKPTSLSCERLKTKLNEIIKKDNLALNISKNIDILTPIEIINKHLDKLRKKKLINKLIIDKTLMSKKFHLADKVFCDDVDFIENDFIHYLMHIQKKSSLLLVTNNHYKEAYTLNKSFRLNEQKASFFIAEPYIKIIEVVKEILLSYNSNDILIVANNMIGIEIITHQLNLNIEQDTQEIKFSAYNDIHGLNAKFIILMDSCIAPFRELAYSFYLADIHTYVIHSEECKQTNSLRNSNESNKN